MLIDGMVLCYAHWRDCAREVRDAYAAWSHSSSSADAAKRFAAYLAALDQEQAHAEAFAQSIEDLAQLAGLQTRR